MKTRSAYKKNYKNLKKTKDDNDDSNSDSNSDSDSEYKLSDTEIDYNEKIDREYEYEMEKDNKKDYDSMDDFINDEEEEEEEDEVENKKIKHNIVLILKNQQYNDMEYEEEEEDDDINCENSSVKCKHAKKKKKYSDIVCKYNNEERKYFNNLSDDEKDNIYNLEKNLVVNTNTVIPSRFKFLNYNFPPMIKSILLTQLEQLNNMHKSSSEYFKLCNWINTLSKIPINKYNELKLNDINNAAMYLENIKNIIDNNIFGHNETKEQIIRILAQWISNPEKTGYVIGIKGPPGVGKTKLVKECICKAMNFPLAFISLGGVDDSSYLSGFNYTYEGSKYGKILDCLIKAQVMNPVFLFDELDKVSATSRGDEIINTLIHITDPIQNEKFTDKYFQEIDLDLSKAIIIFTYNNEEFVNPILKDRMITINVNGYNPKEKLVIAKKYLINELLPKYNMKEGDIIFNDNILEHIINNCSINESGVRNLKRAINNVISWVNMMRYIPTDDIKIELPYEITISYYDKYCKKNVITNEKINTMYL